MEGAGTATASATERGLSSAEAARRYATVGPNEVPEAPPRFLLGLARKFWGPVAWMLEAALAIEAVLRNVPASAILVGLLVFNAAFAQVEEHRAQSAVDLLRQRLRVTSRVLRDGEWRTVPARELVPGDRIHLKAGDIVPADCRLVEGEVEVDRSALTGESRPVPGGAGAALYSASVVRRGEATADVTATGPRSFYGTTVQLVRSARSRSHLERLVFGLVRYLVALDSALAVVVLLVAAVRAVPLAVVLPFVLILLIASVPVALPATFTIAEALESRRLVDEGVLVTDLSAVEEAASMDVLCVDKTGTLTEGQESVGAVAAAGGRADAEVLAWAAAACDAASPDSIDRAVLAEARRRGATPPVRQGYRPFDPALKRSEAWGRLGASEWRAVLGSPAVVAGLCREPVAPPPAVAALSATGARVLAVAAGADGALEPVGFLALADRPRADAAELVRSLRAMGVRVVMLTGDTGATGRAVARAVGLGARFGERTDLDRAAGFDGFAGVYPEDKYRIVRALQGAGHTVGMTGDGVNDAPALKQAEVGVAVASATDVARASAKLVLTRPGLTDLVSAVRSGRAVYRRMLTWTLTKVSKNLEQVVLLTVGFVLAGIFVTRPFLVLLLMFTNDFVTMSVGTDRALSSAVPDRWDVRGIVAVAAVIGAGWLAVSFGLLDWALHGAHMGLGALQTFFFVYLVFSSQGTLFLVRVPGRMWSLRPSGWIPLAMVADGLVVSTLALTGTLMAPIPLAWVLLLLGVVAGAALALDPLKVAILRRAGSAGPRPPGAVAPGPSAP